MEELVVEYRSTDMDGEVELYNRFSELGVGRIEADYFLEEVKDKLWDREWSR